MEIKIGNDLVNIQRFKKTLEKSKIKEKIFLPSELKNSGIQHLAGLFAAKEAVTKALNLKPGNWLYIEISYEKDGCPKVNLHSELRKHILSYSLSIAHDGKYALATVVVLLE